MPQKFDSHPSSTFPVFSFLSSTIRIPHIQQAKMKSAIWRVSLPQQPPPTTSLLLRWVDDLNNWLGDPPLWVLLVAEITCLLILIGLLAYEIVLRIQKDIIYQQCFMDCTATNGAARPTPHLHPEAKLTFREAANKACVYATTREGRAYLKELVKDELSIFWDEAPEAFEFFEALAWNAEWFYEVGIRRLGFREIEGRAFDRTRAGVMWL